MAEYQPVYINQWQFKSTTARQGIILGTSPETQTNRAARCLTHLTLKGLKQQQKISTFLWQSCFCCFLIAQNAINMYLLWCCISSLKDGMYFLDAVNWSNQNKHTCSRVSCFEMVSFSIFLIFFMSLLTWNSCSCSKCCSNSAFSCWSWDGKKSN